MRVIFENTKFIRATTFTNDVTEFLVTVQPNSGNFEVIHNTYSGSTKSYYIEDILQVLESDSIVASGKIRVASDVDGQIGVEDIDSGLLSSTKMVKSDIYKELRLRGYQYR